MVQRVEGLIGTKDVTEWESNFLQSISDKVTKDGGTQNLTEKQIDVLERIHSKHFA
jgi:hypothetical protein